MDVFLLRHGACEDLKDGVKDEDRKLTPEGEDAIKKSLRGMRELTGQIEYILTSPFARAGQTATIVAEYFKCQGFIDMIPALARQGCAKDVSGAVNKLIGKENILVVGHMPHLGELARFWMGDAEMQFNLKKGGIAKIYIKGFPGPGEGVLRWVMTSEELAKAAG